MKVGLIGLPGSGKSSLFALLTGTPSQATPARSHAGIATVPDPRLAALAALYHPGKVTPAHFEVVDMPSLLPGGDATATTRALEAILDADALVHVVRAFDDGHPHPLGDVDPLRDAKALFDELLLADWALVERRLERLRTAKKKQANHELELAFFTRLAEHLEADGAPSDLTWTEAEQPLLRQYPLLTRKPMLVVLNVPESQAVATPGDIAAELEAWAQDHHCTLLVVSVAAELEIGRLAEEDRQLFLEDLGLEEPALARVATAAFRLLGRISFLTAGPKEVRAWSIPEGSTAPRAGRAIHSDIERGFIRAEVVAFADLIACGGWTEAKRRGLVRSEGRDYIVRDGDVIEFLFHV